MAVRLECINIMIPVDTIERKVKGGWTGFVEGKAELPGWCDGRLLRLGTMDPMSADWIITSLEKEGLKARTKRGGEYHWEDLCIVDSFTGPTLPCSWIACDKGYAWLKSEEKGPLVNDIEDSQYPVIHHRRRRNHVPVPTYQAFLDALTSGSHWPPSVLGKDRKLQDIFREIIECDGQTDEPVMGMLPSGELYGLSCMGLENRFGIQFSADELFSHGTLADLYALVKERRRNPPLDDEILRIILAEARDGLLTVDVPPASEWEAFLEYFFQKMTEDATIFDIFTPVLDHYEVDLTPGDVARVNSFFSMSQMTRFIAGKLKKRIRPGCRERYGERWSVEQRMRTLDMLRWKEDSVFGLFIGGFFKHIAGRRYGIMSPEDLSDDRFCIMDTDSRVRYLYDSIEELVEDGWVVD